MNKMFYYIAESKGGIFTTSLIARFASHQHAAEYIEKAVAGWRSEGLETRTTVDDDNMLWGALATTPWHYDGREDTCKVIHLWHIFATPIFMSGGDIAYEDDAKSDEE